MSMKNTSNTLYSPLVKQIYAAFMESGACNSLKAAAKKAWKDLVVEDSGRHKRAAGVARVMIRSFNNYRFERVTEISDPCIMLSKAIMERSSEEEKYQTVSHELAHIIDFYFRGKSNHDQIWRKIHSYMGGDGKRTHDIDISDLRKKVMRVVIESKHDGSHRFITHKHFEKMVAIGRIGIGRLYSLEGFFWFRGDKMLRALSQSEMINKNLVPWAVSCGW